MMGPVLDEVLRRLLVSIVGWGSSIEVKVLMVVHWVREFRGLVMMAVGLLIDGGSELELGLE